MAQSCVTRLVKKFPDHDIDDIRTDVDGRLYVARMLKGTIVVLAGNGRIEREISLTASEPSNLAFGGGDGRTIYVTQRKGGYIESFLVDRPGREFCLQNYRCGISLALTLARRLSNSIDKMRPRAPVCAENLVCLTAGHVNRQRQRMARGESVRMWLPPQLKVALKRGALLSPNVSLSQTKATTAQEQIEIMVRTSCSRDDKNSYSFVCSRGRRNLALLSGYMTSSVIATVEPAPV
jgi:hypothetical protein